MKRNRQDPSGTTTVAQGHFTLRIDLDLGGSGRPENGLWIPAFAGMTFPALLPSFPRRRESTTFGSRVLVLHLTPQREITLTVAGEPYPEHHVIC